MFRQLCGAETLENVVIATTMWSKVTDEEGQKNEQQLRTSPKFFQKALDRGATMLRHDGTLEGAHSLLRKLVGNKPKPLQIQREIVDEKKNIDETAAGVELDKIHQDIIDRMKKEMEEVTESLREANQAEREELEKERADLQRAMDVVRRDNERIAADFAAEREKMRKELEEYQRLLDSAREKEAESSRMGDLVQIWSKISQDHKEFQQS
jgi:flagellar biosynthesis/type III secretory pathway chaperone